MAETDEPASDSIASHTLAYLRRIEKRLEQIWDMLLRHDTRLGRIERDVNEVKSDQVLLENRMLTQTNEILTVVHRIDEQQQRLDRIDTPGS